jgi:hypothetical protein
MDRETRLWGYDVSPQAIALCRPRQNNRLEFIEGNPNTGGTPFDLLLAIDVIEHVEDCFAFLRGLAPLARHHVFHIPLEMHVSAVARMSPLLAARRGVGHIHYFSRETALALLADCGYEILAERYTAGALGLAQSGLATRVARLPRYVASQISTHFAARWLGGFSLLVLAKPRDSI